RTVPAPAAEHVALGWHTYDSAGLTTVPPSCSLKVIQVDEQPLACRVPVTLADRKPSLRGNQAYVSLQIETGVTLQVIPRCRAPSLARGQHHVACIRMSGKQ